MILVCIAYSLASKDSWEISINSPIFFFILRLIHHLSRNLFSLFQHILIKKKKDIKKCAHMEWLSVFLDFVTTTGKWILHQTDADMPLSSVYSNISEGINQEHKTRDFNKQSFTLKCLSLH